MVTLSHLFLCCLFRVLESRIIGKSTVRELFTLLKTTVITRKRKQLLAKEKKKLVLGIMTAFKRKCQIINFRELRNSFDAVWWMQCPFPLPLSLFICRYIQTHNTNKVSLHLSSGIVSVPKWEEERERESEGRMEYYWGPGSILGIHLGTHLRTGRDEFNGDSGKKGPWYANSSDSLSLTTILNIFEFDHQIAFSEAF